MQLRTCVILCLAAILPPSLTAMAAERANPKTEVEALHMLDQAERWVAAKGEGHFPVMIKLRDGSLAAVFRGGAGHLGIQGRIDFTRSTDDGRHWSPASRCCR